jgi:transposase
MHEGSDRERKAPVLFDRLYGSLEFINFLEEKGVKYIIRLQAGKFKAEVSGMRGKDEWVVLEHTRERLNNLRNSSAKRRWELAEKGHTSVRMRFADGEHGMLVTNLKEGSGGEIQRLYRRRWKIEQKYHTLKNKMKFESVTGKASVYVEQDFRAQMLVFNIVQDLISAAQRRAVRESKQKKCLYEMQINENIAIGLFKEQFIRLMMAEDDEMKGALFKRLISDMEQHVVPVRKLKSSPRKWNIANKYKCNQKPSF